MSSSVTGPYWLSVQGLQAGPLPAASPAHKRTRAMSALSHFNMMFPHPESAQRLGIQAPMADDGNLVPRARFG
jgi:hypothetical protein